MIKLFKNKKESCDIYSPIKGIVDKIENVNDKMFADKLLGDGISLILEDEMIYAPCNGVVSMIAITKHAIGLKSEVGADILIHVGLETCNLKGEGFEVLVNEGEKVKTGDRILRVNKSLFNKNEIDLTTPMVVTNGNDFKVEVDCNKGRVTLNDVLMHISKK